MDEVHIPTQSELGRQEPEVVLAGDEVRRRRHVDQDIHFGGVDLGVDESGAPGSERQVTVVQAALGPAPLASPAELIVQPPLMDAEVLDDPFGLQWPTVRANGTKVLEDLLVGDSVFGQVGTDPDQGDRDLGSQPWNRRTGHRTTSQSGEIGSPAGRGSTSIQRLSGWAKQWQRSQSPTVMAARPAAVRHPLSGFRSRRRERQRRAPLKDLGCHCASGRIRRVGPTHGYEFGVQRFDGGQHLIGRHADA